ncbi:hypothetical protein BDZ91DRAFT_764007 [Kalaharituber pfeilii]|nr:hypothetical protein BDZ91DRAFT_764007 [Kalaharituber pfeilii]
MHPTLGATTFVLLAITNYRGRAYDRRSLAGDGQEVRSPSPTPTSNSIPGLDRTMLEPTVTVIEDIVEAKIVWAIWSSLVFASLLCLLVWGLRRIWGGKAAAGGLKVVSKLEDRCMLPHNKDFAFDNEAMELDAVDTDIPRARASSAAPLEVSVWTVAEVDPALEVVCDFELSPVVTVAAKFEGETDIIGEPLPTPPLTPNLEPSKGIIQGRYFSFAGHEGMDEMPVVSEGLNGQQDHQVLEGLMRCNDLLVSVGPAPYEKAHAFTNFLDELLALVGQLEAIIAEHLPEAKDDEKSAVVDISVVPKPGDEELVQEPHVPENTSAAQDAELCSSDDSDFDEVSSVCSDSSDTSSASCSSQPSDTNLSWMTTTAELEALEKDIREKKAPYNRKLSQEVARAASVGVGRDGEEAGVWRGPGEGQDGGLEKKRGTDTLEDPNEAGGFVTPLKVTSPRAKVTPTTPPTKLLVALTPESLTPRTSFGPGRKAPNTPVRDVRAPNPAPLPPVTPPTPTPTARRRTRIPIPTSTNPTFSQSPSKSPAPSSLSILTPWMAKMDVVQKWMAMRRNREEEWRRVLG